ncbi:MAG: TonB-dependent receptor [Luteibaculum sp.]
MLKHLLKIFLFLSCPTALFGQNDYYLGTVKDAIEVLPGANVFYPNSTQGTITDQYGRFKIRKNPNADSLCVSFLGYERICRATKDLAQNIVFELEKNAIVTQEVEIEAERKTYVQDVQMSTQKMDMKQIEELPAFMGEVDVLKSIQLLPGVQSAGEGNAGYYVRGGGPDQNLILLDKAPVYNASHLLGLFSIFNHNAIGDPTLIKGGMPARFGNRLASVLEIPTKTGDFQKHNFGGGIGLIASRFHANGPIVKDKVSYLVTGRRTYIDAVAGPFIPDDSQAKGSAYFFYDVNAKISAKLSPKDQLDVSFYTGEDVFKFVNTKSEINLRIPWGNTLVQAIYTKQLSNKLSADLYAYYDRYQFALQSQFDQFSVGVQSSIDDYTLGSDWRYQLHEYHLLEFGVQSSRNIYLPSFAEASSADTDFNTGPRNRLHSNQLAFYIQDRWVISPLLTVPTSNKLGHLLASWKLVQEQAPEHNALKKEP